MPSRRSVFGLTNCAPRRVAAIRFNPLTPSALSGLRALLACSCIRCEVVGNSARQLEHGCAQLSFSSFESALLVRDAHGRYLPTSVDLLGLYAPTILATDGSVYLVTDNTLEIARNPKCFPQSAPPPRHYWLRSVPFQ